MMLTDLFKSKKRDWMVREPIADFPSPHFPVPEHQLEDPDFVAINTSVVKTSLLRLSNCDVDILDLYIWCVAANTFSVQINGVTQIGPMPMLANQGESFGGLKLNPGEELLLILTAATQVTGHIRYKRTYRLSSDPIGAVTGSRIQVPPGNGITTRWLTSRRKLGSQ